MRISIPHISRDLLDTLSRFFFSADGRFSAAFFVQKQVLAASSRETRKRKRTKTMQHVFEVMRALSISHSHLVTLTGKEGNN
jgi:hypothetical protein